MKIGIIGIGDIAQKAYLPVLSRHSDIELHLCTRNQHVLHDMAAMYKLTDTFTSMHELIQSKIQAAFVHSSTESHADIVDTLLDHNIHVFVDKPISYDLETATRLVNKAKEKKRILMVGFNRRFAPPYGPLKELANPNMVIVEKHRAHHPDYIRRFIFDDFIHVIDTLLNLFPYSFEQFTVHGRQVDGKLYHVTLQLEAEEGTAIGIMNRDSGMNEEVVKVFSSEETRIVKNISDCTSLKGRQAHNLGTDDWEPTLHKRGFHHMTRIFIDAVKNNDVEQWDYKSDLQRHLIAELIVKALENGNSHSVQGTFF